MIESIKLKDFISHEDTTIVLEDGINVFVGSNGAGKSSVIDAITYALYGRHTRERDKNLVRRGSSTSAVSLTFTYGSDRYVVERVIAAGGKLERAVLKQLAPVERTLIAGERKQYEESINSRISTLLRLDYDKMRVAAIIQQGELDSIIQYKPSQFKELMDSLIGIDRLGSAYEAMRGPIDEFRERLREECLGKYDDRNYQQLLDDINMLNSDLKKSMESLESANQDLAAVNEKFEKVKARILELEPLRLKREELKRQEEQLKNYINKLLEELNKRKGELESDIPNAQKMLEMAAKAEAMRADYDRAAAEESSINDAINELESQISRAKKSSDEISDIDNSIREEKEELERVSDEERSLQEEVNKLSLEEPPSVTGDLDKIINDLQSKRDALLYERAKISERIKNYNEIINNGECPTCGSDVKEIRVEFKLSQAESELKRVVSELKSVDDSLSEFRAQQSAYNEHKLRAQKIEDKMKMIKQYMDRESRSKQKLENLFKRRKELEVEASKLEPLEEEKRAKRAKLREIKERERSLLENLNAATGAVSWLKAKGINSQSDVERMNDELNDIVKKIRAIEEGHDISSLAIDEISGQLVKSVIELEEQTKQYDEGEYMALRKEMDKTNAEVIKIGGMVEAIKAKIDELRAEQGQLDAVKATVERAKEYLMIYEKIRNDLFNRDGPLATSLRSWAIKELSFYASEYVRSFGIGISEIRLSEKRRDVSIESYSGSGVMDIRSLSGGESVAIALAIRFAMAKLMGLGLVDFIILDEPTVYLDEERKRSLVNIISNFNAGQGALKQMVIITHDREIFENSAVDAIFQFEKHNGITAVQKA